MSLKYKLLIEPKEIHKKVRQAAREIAREYQTKDLVIVMVLKGAICLVADLIRELHIPFELETVQCSSYGERGAERGDLEIFGADRLRIHNRDVLVVDDIFDTGNTLEGLCAALSTKQPRSLKSLVLLSREIPTKKAIKPDWILFSIPDHFVVGFGLDYKELYRGLNGIFSINP